MIINATHRFQQRRVDRYRETARKLMNKYANGYKFCETQGYHVPVEHTCAGCRCCDKGA